MAQHKCHECLSGDYGEPEPTVALVSVPNDPHPNLVRKLWVCREHLIVLRDDYGDDLRILREEGDDSRLANQPGDDILLGILKGQPDGSGRDD